MDSPCLQYFVAEPDLSQWTLPSASLYSIVTAKRQSNITIRFAVSLTVLNGPLVVQDFLLRVKRINNKRNVNGR